MNDYIEKETTKEEYRYFLKKLLNGDIDKKYTDGFIENTDNIKKLEAMDCFIGYLKSTNCFNWKETKEENERYENWLYDVLEEVDFEKIKNDVCSFENLLKKGIYEYYNSEF